MDPFDFIQNTIKAIEKRFGKDKAELALFVVGIAIVFWALKFLVVGIFSPFYLFLTEKGIEGSKISLVGNCILFFLLLITSFLTWRVRRMTKQVKRLIEKGEKSKNIAEEYEKKSKGEFEKAEALVNKAEALVNKAEALVNKAEPLVNKAEPLANKAEELLRTIKEKKNAQDTDS